jgi:SHR-binding domain of vacuolar-sorting associated protein 13
MTSMIPKHGTSYGALRVARARFPRVLPSSQHPDTTAVSTSVYELCYSVSALDNLWGEVSRIMIGTSRFLLRNDSKDLVFEVKQSGSDDRTAFRVGPGETTPFHWANFKLPELISVRPLLKYDGIPAYQWSGGLDPLTIGAVPLRIRRSELPPNSFDRASREWNVRSIQVEAEIRPGTGGTGINICFQEEDPNGAGALFRIENHSLFPLWFSQDGLLANLNLSEDGRDRSANGDLIRPSESFVFALDVPFRQGKYAGRRAATIDELLRVRLALAPLCSRSGIETTKGVSFITAGERVRLNPSKLMFLESRLRKSLGRVRVLGIVINDGPTRVLRFW